MKKLVCVVFVLLVLPACSRYLTHGEALYLQSRNGEMLVVPPPLTNEHINHFYDLPPQNENAQIDIAPPTGG